VVWFENNYFYIKMMFGPCSSLSCRNCLLAVITIYRSGKRWQKKTPALEYTIVWFNSLYVTCMYTYIDMYKVRRIHYHMINQGDDQNESKREPVECRKMEKETREEKVKGDKGRGVNLFYSGRRAMSLRRP